MTIEKVVGLTVSKYFSVITKIKDLGFNVWAWNVILPQRKYIDSDGYPSVGTYDERKKATQLFNEKLRSLCNSNGVKFVYFKAEIDGEHYLNEIHLSQKAMPIVIRKLEDMGIKIERQIIQ